MSLAKQLSRLEGWKYTSLYSAEQADWAIVPEQDNEPLVSPQFDNKGDQLIAQKIVQHCDSVTQHVLGSDQSDTQDLAIALKGSSKEQIFKIVHVTVKADHPATLTETITANQSYMHQLTIIHVEKGASLSHFRLLDDQGLQSTILAPVFVQVEEGGHYIQILTGKGAKTARFTTQVEILGEGANVDLRGVYKLEGDSHLDHTIVMRHLAPRCVSNQSIRLIALDEGQGTFQGKIHVQKDSQETQAYQLCKSLILSDRAQMNMIPELEIFADDVKCSHGATSGALDDAMLFYLQSRGIPYVQAQALLKEAFLKDAFDGINVPPHVQDFLL